jgi:uncharacterized protein with HEPN domain
MRDEGLYLQDIVDSADEIKEFLGGASKDEFTQNSLLRSAVLQKLMVIGEAAARVSRELRDRHPEIQWPRIVAFRNVAAHAYFAVDWNLVWRAAAVEAPMLRDQVAKILSAEYPLESEEE